ncbi:MAG: arginine--tRNA ligase [Acidobacteria bacterium RIFCSPLOWO2_02_FULL_67_36]|nr:MAG: arginine--tRNA ligase [Acidobacteria bacterium RIFCSPLOWO2_02_FULL_67_36]OFW21550.1 MAG: arginine--tRNA ligase [Acidobacteria bacterium RIFCSPLOWO2_12_FULL_66_21]
MVLPIQQTVRARMADAVSRLYGIAGDDPVLAAIPVELPPRRALGDMAVPLAFNLARRLRKAPRAIAREIVEALGAIDGVARIEAAPNGYVNFFLDRAAFTLEWLRGGTARPQPDTAKAIVEHTAINPNKAAHIGHLRNAALGDAFGRLLRFVGRDVEIQNYIDDTGVQVADVAVGFRELEHCTLDEVRTIAESSRFDYYCWDLYARVTEWYEEDADRLRVRAAALHDIERGDNETARLAHFIADRIVRCHLATMRRMNIRYDLLTWEGDILRLHFWTHAFEFLKKTGAVFLQTEGKLEGCWVMPIDEDEAAGGEEPADVSADLSARASADPMASADAKAEQREKVIVRSDGTVTYVGKDMAYQLWKFGLLGKDFHYRIFEQEAGGKALWSTTSNERDADAGAPSFGRAAWVCNVIDTRQSYLQKLLKQALAALGFDAQAAHSIHYAYEMVALSHATARELGYATSVDSDRPFVEVSGRRGLGVKADDLLDRLTAKAAAEVSKRNPEMSEADVRGVAEAIATSAVRYFMVKFSRGKVIVFDIDEALSFEGESGPYLQYAVVRANNIFNKLQERLGIDEAGVIAAVASASTDVLTADSDEAHELWGLVLEAARLDEIVEQAVRTRELSVLAKYAFGLAQAFNGFYHKYQILNEERDDVRTWRAAAVAYYRAQLTRALDLMGCTVPAKM